MTIQVNNQQSPSFISAWSRITEGTARSFCVFFSSTQLRQGNSFGWTTLEDISTLAAATTFTRETFSWESLQARIVVNQSQPLCVTHIESPFLTEAPQTVGHGRLAELEGISKQFADLWLHTSAPPLGVGVQPSGRLRALFLTALWGPLVDRLEEHDDEARRRQRRGYRTHDQFPLEGYQLAELRTYVLHLTEIWYGSEIGGNVSVIYRWFLKTMELIGVTAYSMSDIPTETTPDGWAVIVDASTRSKVLKGRGGQDASYVAAGGLRQKQGRSAIDNTSLANVFTAAEARVLLVGRRMRKVLCRLIALRQRCILRKLSHHLHIDLLSHASEDGTGRGHRLVRSILRALSKEDFIAADVNADGFCFKELLARGAVLSGFGQLEPSDQKTIWDFASGLLFPGGDPHNTAPKEDSKDVFDQLVLWSRKFPGEYFENKKLRHFEVMLSGLWCNRVVLVKKSAMERLTLARYFSLHWLRTQPLWAVFKDGAPHEIRQRGMREASRVRANECPYANNHGMSLPSGGFARDDRLNLGKKSLKEANKCTTYSLMMEAQWVQDPAGNIENWFLIDIEKIVQEVWQLNPHGDKSMMLPGEMFVNVGQNPKIGSSIKQTQHTQLREASLSSLPMLQVCSPGGPRRSEALDASIDFVDIGPLEAAPEACAFWVKVLTSRPANPAISEFLVELRLRLLAKFGGAEVLDFLVQAVSDEHGGFVILFAAIPQLEKIGTEPNDVAPWSNPLTGERSESVGLAVAYLDFGKGVGQFLCSKPSQRDQLMANGQDTMRRLWAFNRVPGIREFVQEFAKERRIFE